MTQTLTKEQGREILKSPRRHKYNIQQDSHKSGKEARTIDGRTFGSLREAKRYCELKREFERGRIMNLRCQVRIPLMVDGIKIGNYVADFTYENYAGWTIYEDAKGSRTPLYRWKRKHAAAQGILIDEV